MKFSLLTIAAATWTVAVSAADQSSFNLRHDDAQRLLDSLAVDDSKSMSMAAIAADASPTSKSGKQGGKSGKMMDCPAGTRKLVKEKYRGKITGYQNRVFYNTVGNSFEGAPPNSSFPLPLITVGSITSGKLYRVDAFRDEENGNPAIPDEEPIGTFIIDTASIKDYVDDDDRRYGDYTVNHSKITICEHVELFGGCSTFIQGGDWAIPSIDFAPETLDLVTYLGAGASGVGAAGYNLVDRKAYVDARYNYNDQNGTFPGYGIDSGTGDEIFTGQELSGFEFVAAHGYCQPKPGFDGANCTRIDGFCGEKCPPNPCGDNCTREFAEVTRQSRDFEVTSFALTSKEIESFLDMAAFSPIIFPVEAKPGVQRFPIDGNIPEIPDREERSTAIDKYLEDRYAEREYQCVEA